MWKRSGLFRIELGALILALTLGRSARAEPLNSPKNAEESPIALRYQEAAARILGESLVNNQAYRKLEELCDGIGHRLSGSASLEKAIDWAVAALKKDGQENVRREKVMVPHWVRGNESLTMIKPRAHPITMLGLGGSVGTPPEGITAAVVSVRDEAELASLGEEAKGKIILFDNVMPPYDPVNGTKYGETVRFRSKGPRLASEKGAVACLVRSVTARSLRSPHTGATNYGDAAVKIPAAAISTEDAALISRLLARGQKVEVSLKMEAQILPEAESANVVGELRGSTWPDEVVVIGGHIDSWDVGQGAQDDGTGCVMAMEAISVLRRLKMIPRRTIRVVLWTNEENGLAGGRTYAKDHVEELANHVAAIESDSGGFRPSSYSVDCLDKERESQAVQQLQQVMKLLVPVGPIAVTTGGSGADIGPLKPAGVLLMGHHTDSATYFDYHHSHADTLDKVDPVDLSKNVGALATIAYIIADLPERFGVQAKLETVVLPVPIPTR